MLGVQDQGGCCTPVERGKSKVMLQLIVRVGSLPWIRGGTPLCAVHREARLNCPAEVDYPRKGSYRQVGQDHAYRWMICYVTDLIATELITAVRLRSNNSSFSNLS